MRPTGLINRAGDKCKTCDELWVRDNSSHSTRQVPSLHSQKMRYFSCKGFVSLDYPCLLVFPWSVSSGCLDVTINLPATGTGCDEGWVLQSWKQGLEQIPAHNQSSLQRLWKEARKVRRGEGKRVKEIWKVYLCLTNKMNALFRNTFKELPWSFHLSFCKTYSSCLWTACFIGWEKMNTVPPQLQGQKFLLHPTVTHISYSQNMVRCIWKQETHWSQLLILPHLPEAGEQEWLHVGGEECILTPLVRWWEDFFSLHGKKWAAGSWDAQPPCSHWPDPESYFFKWHAKKCHRISSNSDRKCFCSRIFSSLSSSPKLWLQFLTCPTCTSADLKFPGNIFHLRAHTTYFHWRWEKGSKVFAKHTDGKRVNSGFASEPWMTAGRRQSAGESMGLADTQRRGWNVAGEFSVLMRASKGLRTPVKHLHRQKWWSK